MACQQHIPATHFRQSGGNPAMSAPGQVLHEATAVPVNSLIFYSFCFHTPRADRHYRHAFPPVWRESRHIYPEAEVVPVRVAC